MKQYNKLGLIAAVIIVLTILLLSNVTELARLVRYEPLTTDSPLLINIAVSNALTLISIKCVFYTYTIYYSVVLFYKVYQKDNKRKELFDSALDAVKQHIRNRDKVSSDSPKYSKHKEGVAMDIISKPLTPNEAFNPKVVDLEFEPKIPNRLRLECYDTYNTWVSALLNDKTRSHDEAVKLNKLISKLSDLLGETHLVKADFHSKPKFIVDNVDLSLTELNEVKGFLTNELEEYINILVNGEHGCR